MCKENCDRCKQPFNRSNSLGDRFLVEYKVTWCLDCAEETFDGTIRTSDCRDCNEKLIGMYDKWFLCDNCKSTRKDKSYE